MRCGDTVFRAPCPVPRAATPCAREVIWSIVRVGEKMPLRAVSRYARSRWVISVRTFACPQPLATKAKGRVSLVMAITAESPALACPLSPSTSYSAFFSAAACRELLPVPAESLKSSKVLFTLLSPSRRLSGSLICAPMPGRMSPMSSPVSCRVISAGSQRQDNLKTPRRFPLWLRYALRSRLLRHSLTARLKPVMPE